MRLSGARSLGTLGLIVVVTADASAQRFRVREGPGVPVRFPPAYFGDGAFTHCKIMYRSVWREADGMGWSTDYPYASIDLMIRLGELTKAPISVDGDGNPNYWVVRLTDDALFAMATDVGTLEFSDEEVRPLSACSRVDFSGWMTSGARKHGNSGRTRFGKCYRSIESWTYRRIIPFAA